MPSLAKLQRDVEHLRAVVALQRLHAQHTFSGSHRADLALLWRGAQFGGSILHYEAGGDPAMLVTIYLEHALRKYRAVMRIYSHNQGASALAQQNQQLRDSGVHNVPRLVKALEAYQAAGGQRPAGGWGVPYVAWDHRTRQPLPERRVLLGGGPALLARKADAARRMSASALAELSHADAFLVATAMGIERVHVPLSYPERAQLVAQIIDAQRRLPGMQEEPTPAPAAI